MEKYLFTDGTNVIREVESDEELQSFIQSSAEPARVRIWIFNTNEWISLAEFNKRSHKAIVPEKKSLPPIRTKQDPKAIRKPAIPSWIRNLMIGIIAAAAIFLVYNFTKVTWRKTASITLSAERPVNAPPVNVDSAAENIELSRGQKLDKIARTNLRIRNNWPDLIQLQLTADRDTSREGLRYYNTELSIDNSTGYNIDNAIVKYSFWKDGQLSHSDTTFFSNITYAEPAKRKIEGVFSADSVSVAFYSIRARYFNFCYSSEKKNTYGSYNDRWYCK
jgi:hypothetical protein